MKNKKEIPDEFITISDYWHEKGKKIEHISVKKIFRRYKTKIKEMFEIIFKVKIISNKSLEDISYKSYIIDDNIILSRNNLLVFELINFLKTFLLNISYFEASATLNEYNKLYYNNPFKNKGGGMGYNNGLFFYFFIKFIEPDVVIESGLWRGFTTYLIDHATKNTTQLFCFDINLKLIKYKSKKANYFEFDLNSFDFSKILKNKKVLAFFDDHVSQYDRLKFCNKNNIKYSIFDDDVSFYNVHSDGWPPIPTISMLFNENLKISQFEWVSNNRKLIANINDAINDKSINAENYIFETPLDLFELTGYRNSSRTTYILNKNI